MHECVVDTAHFCRMDASRQGTFCRLRRQEGGLYGKREQHPTWSTCLQPRQSCENAVSMGAFTIRAYWMSSIARLRRWRAARPDGER